MVGRFDHNIPPIYDEKSEILILGSFPSVLSREKGFYYMHPQNRFWKVISVLFDVEDFCDVEYRKDLLLDKKIALWDIVKSCSIEGSSDSKIKDIYLNDIEHIVSNSNISAVYCNGRKAYDLYKRFFSKKLNLSFFYLPSTSPANNVNIKFDDLCVKWKVICRNFL